MGLTVVPDINGYENTFKKIVPIYSQKMGTIDILLKSLKSVTALYAGRCEKHRVIGTERSMLKTSDLQNQPLDM